MPAFVIHYDLYQGDRSDYEELYDALERSKAVRATESTWFVSTSWNAIKVRDYLKNYMHPKDVICLNLLTVGSGFASNNLSQEAIRWMKTHLKLKKLA